MKINFNILKGKFNNGKENINKKKMKKKIKKNFENSRKQEIQVYKICSLILISLMVILTLGESIFAATTPTLVSKLNTALNKILSYLEKLAPAAAGVAIASGVMIRKFSFGDEQKMILGKKIIINALVGYAIILLIDTILKFVDGLV